MRAWAGAGLACVLAVSSCTSMKAVWAMQGEASGTAQEEEGSGHGIKRVSLGVSGWGGARWGRMYQTISMYCESMAFPIGSRVFGVPAKR